MFSGITETLGQIMQIDHQKDGLHFCISHHGLFNDIKIGDSIAVNGVCLTVTSFDEKTFRTTAVPETLRLTNLCLLENQDSVNLERSICANQRIGGHFVQGHVDAMATIEKIEASDNGAYVVTFNIAPEHLRYIIKKGFIAIDGMSITIVDVNDEHFSVMFIPHTRENTVVKQYQVGHRVNIEVDMMNKTIEKLLRGMPHAASH